MKQQALNSHSRNRLSILLLCPHFSPDYQAATGEVMTQLVEQLAKRGHTISVVTSLPWYQLHDVEPEWRGRLWRTERTEWGRIVRVWPFPTNKNNIFARALAFVAQSLLSTFSALRLGRHDVVMGMSPPIFFGDAAWLVAKRSRAPFVFNIQDIFPDVALELDALRSPWLIKLARRYELALYKRASAITVLSQDQADNVTAKLTPALADKVHIIHNSVDLQRIKPQTRQGWYRERHGLGEKFVVMYSGNVGLSQPFDLIRLAAEKLAHDPSVVFVINGEGAARPQVEAWAESMDNVKVIDFSPRELVSDVLAAADLHLVLLKAGLARSSTPSKLYSILAAGRPVLASIDLGSEVAKVLELAEAGFTVEAGDESEFCLVLEQLIENPSVLDGFGQAGRKFVSQWMSPEAQAGAYEELFKELL